MVFPVEKTYLKLFRIFDSLISLNAVPKLREYVVLGSRESLMRTVTTRSLASTWGVFGIVGDTMRFSLMFCRVTYSSKFMVINLGAVFTAESLGTANSNRGGKLSLGPPLGGIILAQELIIELMDPEINKLNNIFFSAFIVLLDCANLTAFL